MALKFFQNIYQFLQGSKVSLVVLFLMCDNLAICCESRHYAKHAILNMKRQNVVATKKFW